MGKTKTLTEQELSRVQDYIASWAHAARNTAMLLLTHRAGMRVGEVAALTWGDVVNAEDRVKDEIRLNTDQTTIATSASRKQPLIGWPQRYERPCSDPKSDHLRPCQVHHALQLEQLLRYGSDRTRAGGGTGSAHQQALKPSRPQAPDGTKNSRLMCEPRSFTLSRNWVR